MRRWGFAATLVLVAGLMVPLGGAVSSIGASTDYVVVYRPGTTLADARSAIEGAGGTLVRENTTLGVATVTSVYTDFTARVARQEALFGAARNRPIGFTTAERRPAWLAQAELTKAERRKAAARSARATKRVAASAEGAEPLASLQWDMEMINATVDGSYDEQDGSKKVLVGIIDTGVDGSHPDIKPNFNKTLSRNFTTDIPTDSLGNEIDGPCADEPDNSCEDPADVDENGHGTHVAGIVGAALNGLGTAGVAPGVTLVNVRAGQDSGFFFLQETVDALTYAGKAGIDVVNMSFFIDPWLYNCTDNPADSAEEQAQQRTIREATQRALNFAHRKHVTLVAALGNDHTDLGNPTIDTISPDFPLGTEKTRTVDNTCLDLPAEGKHVISVSSLGPSERKSDFSNYGVEQTDVSAPGGWFRDLLGTPQHRTVATQILSPYPESLAIANGELNPDGTPNTPFVVRDCEDEVCAYYQYLQGTSMAAPHAAGVAALIVSEFGVKDGKHKGGLTINPTRLRNILFRTARNHACPDPRLFSYEDVGRPPSFNAFCEGGTSFNGFYGHGIVDALAAVTD